MFNLCFQTLTIEVKLSGQTKQLQAEMKASRFNNYLHQGGCVCRCVIHCVNMMAQKVLNEFC